MYSLPRQKSIQTSQIAERKKRENSFSPPPRRTNENNNNRFSRVLAIGFPSAPFTDEEVSLATTVRENISFVRSFPGSDHSYNRVLFYCRSICTHTTTISLSYFSHLLYRHDRKVERHRPSNSLRRRSRR